MNPAKDMRKKSFSRDFDALSSMIWVEREERAVSDQIQQRRKKRGSLT